MTYIFQSTLPVRGGTESASCEICEGKISIHPPRAGRDTKALFTRREQDFISIHPPRAGRDNSPVPFLCFRCDFNPPSPCGEGRNNHPQQMLE